MLHDMSKTFFVVAVALVLGLGAAHAQVTVTGITYGALQNGGNI